MANMLIIGASSGTGFSLAKQLMAEGHHVYGTFHKTTSAFTDGVIKMQPLNVLDENLDLSFVLDRAWSMILTASQGLPAKCAGNGSDDQQ